MFVNIKKQGKEFFKIKKYKNAIESYTNGLKDESLLNSDKAILLLNRSICNMHLY